MTGPDAANDLTTSVLAWLLRLPFLGAEELALLLHTDEASARRLLSELERLGWVEWIVPSSPELAPRRLFVLTEAATLRVGAIPPAAEGERRGGWAVGWAEMLLRLLRLETTVGLNRFLAGLIAALPHDGSMALTGVRSLPWTAQRERHWWPRGVEGYGCLRAGPWMAPFFVAWDRPGAPSFHRRLRVARWYSFREEGYSWGSDDLPPILVVCAGEREAETWADAVLAGADRRGCPPLTAFLATADSLRGHSLAAAWRRPEGRLLAPLSRRLRWLRQLPLTDMPAAIERNSLAPEDLPRAGTPLRTWARAAAVPDDRHRLTRDTEWLAAISLVAAPDDKLALQWLGRHPFLSATDLTVLLDQPHKLVERRLDRLVAWRLIDRVIRLADGEACAVPRYFLTDDGLRLLAESAGVPPHRYARHSALAAAPDVRGWGGRRLSGLLRHFEHTVGANRFFVRLTADAREAGQALLRWQSAAECAEQFMHDERRHLLRPDGAGELRWDGRIRRFLLEWDLGTSRWPDMIEKCQLYAAYIAQLRAAAIPLEAVPSVLMVTTSPQRERVIWRCLKGAYSEVSIGGVPCFTTVSGLLDRTGPLGRIWRLHSDQGRQFWPR